ncbi:hypothetical protein PAAL109150_23570 [Paenibacillus alkaliterrae]|uniref:hypothetical protein n=1 Tax=Paenibacillus alkaliterrae TaxID=320909 RepID=UPI0038B28057
MSESKTIYRTQQVWIKPGHRLYAYLEQICQHAKNMYNTTNFFIRQVFTAYQQNEPLQPLQQHVIDTMQMHLDAIIQESCVKAKSRAKVFIRPDD